MDDVDKIIFRIREVRDDLTALKEQEPGNQRLADAQEVIELLNDALDVLIPF
jgi:hypothetical protein